MFTGVTAFAENEDETAPAEVVDDFAGVPKDTEDYEAITVLHAAGIIDGRDDGTYHPADKITRAEAAKLIAYAALSAATASRLPTNAGNTFTDIDAANQFASGAIAYLTQQGAINGTNYEQTLFDPGSDITGVAVMKILLGVLGYGANDEFIGTLWETNTITHAAVLGLSAGVDSEYGAPATRKDVARYIFTALTIQRVYFDDVTHTYVTGAVYGERIVPSYTLAPSYGFLDIETQVISATGFTALSNTGYTIGSQAPVTTAVVGYYTSTGVFTTVTGAVPAANLAGVKTIVTGLFPDGRSDDQNGDGVIDASDRVLNGYSPVLSQTTEEYLITPARLDSLMQINGLSRVQIENETVNRDDAGQLITPLGYLYYRWEKAATKVGITEWARDVANEKVIGETVINPDRTNAAGPFLNFYEGLDGKQIPLVSTKTYLPFTFKTFVNGGHFRDADGIAALAGMTGLKVVVLDQRLSGVGVYNPVTGNFNYEGKSLNNYNTWEFDGEPDKLVAYYEVYGTIRKVANSPYGTTYTIEVASTDPQTFGPHRINWTKDEVTYTGAAGLFSKDDKVRVIVQLDSTKTGLGTTASPYIYTLDNQDSIGLAKAVIRVEEAEVKSTKVNSYGYTKPAYAQDFWNVATKYNHVLLAADKADKTWINFTYINWLGSTQYGNTKSVKKLVVDENGYILKGLEEAETGNYGIITNIYYTSLTDWTFDADLGILKGDSIRVDPASLWKYSSLTNPTNAWNKYLDKLNAKVGIAVEYDGLDMIRIAPTGFVTVTTKGKLPGAPNTLPEIGDGAFWVRFEADFYGEPVGTVETSKTNFVTDLYAGDEVWYFTATDNSGATYLIGAAAWAAGNGVLGVPGGDVRPYADIVYNSDVQRYLTLTGTDSYAIGSGESLTITGALTISDDAVLSITGTGNLVIADGAVVDLTGADIGGFGSGSVAAISETGLTTTEAGLISDLFDALGMEVGASLKLTVEQLEATLNSNDYFNANAGVVTFTKTTAGNAYSTPTVTGNASGAYHTLVTSVTATDINPATATSVIADVTVTSLDINAVATYAAPTLKAGLQTGDATFADTYAWTLSDQAIALTVNGTGTAFVGATEAFTVPAGTAAIIDIAARTTTNGTHNVGVAATYEVTQVAGTGANFDLAPVLAVSNTVVVV
jgi:hypothetical protein